MTSEISKRASTRSVLHQMLDAPHLVEHVRGLAPASFSNLLRRIGIEDAGEIAALATKEQIVAAFDEDLFSSAHAGERETFDPDRFSVWLEILLEAGEASAAERIADLDEDFVAHALSSLVLVFDEDTLDARLREGDEDARVADKALDACLSESLDGYLLVSRKSDGWDAALNLVLALDRDHRGFLTRVLDRCVAASSGYVDALDELASVLSAAESLADDVEAAREERRSELGYVEARAAKVFLDLARKPVENASNLKERDVNTRNYLARFRPLPRATGGRASKSSLHHPLPQTSETGSASSDLALIKQGADARRTEDRDRATDLAQAMRTLASRAPDAHEARTEELVYLANVLLAGAELHGERLTQAQAAETVLLTVELGANLEAKAKDGTGSSGSPRHPDLTDVLERCPCDLLFRKARGTLMTFGGASSPGLIRSRDELRTALVVLGASREVKKLGSAPIEPPQDPPPQKRQKKRRPQS